MSSDYARGPIRAAEVTAPAAWNALRSDVDEPVRTTAEVQRAIAGRHAATGAEMTRL